MRYTATYIDNVEGFCDFMNRRLPFTLEATASGTAARAATFQTLHGTIQTPFSCQWAPKLASKGCAWKTCVCRFANPLGEYVPFVAKAGPDVFQKIGGIHKYTGWQGSVLTDSGGFQIFSLDHARQIVNKAQRFAATSMVISFTCLLKVVSRCNAL